MKVVYTEKGVYLCESVEEATNGNLRVEQGVFLADEGRGFKVCALCAGAFLKAENMKELRNTTVTGDYEVRDLDTMEQAQFQVAEATFAMANEFALKDVTNKYFDQLLRGK